MPFKDYLDDPTWIRKKKQKQREIQESLGDLGSLDDEGQSTYDRFENLKISEWTGFADPHNASGSKWPQQALDQIHKKPDGSFKLNVEHHENGKETVKCKFVHFSPQNDALNVVTFVLTQDDAGAGYYAYLQQHGENELKPLIKFMYENEMTELDKLEGNE